MGRDGRQLGRTGREEMPTLGVEDLTYDPRLSEDAITAEDPPRRWEQVGAAPLAASQEEEAAPLPQRFVQQYRPSHYIPSSSRMVAEDAMTESPSLAPIAIEVTPQRPHAVDVWFADTSVNHLVAPGSRTTMRTRGKGMSVDAQRGTRAAVFVGAFGAVAMAMFIWGISAIAGTGPEMNRANASSASPAPAESWVLPVMDLPVLAKAAEARASRAQ